MRPDERRRRVRTGIWALSVGVVLADSSIVTLALPEILARFDTSVFGVSWVLTAFNIVLALVVLPAAIAARRRPSLLWAVGLTVFAAASVGCALAPSIGALIAGRCAQAVGGAAVIAGAIELLSRVAGGHRDAARLWGAAGLAGLALGPAVGGLLTELLSWQSIFYVQVPLVVALPFARAVAARPEPGAGGRIALQPELGLAVLSAGLTGALFLLVLMLTEAWQLGPLAAAAVVTAMPAATVLAGALTRSVELTKPVLAAGAIAVAAGLAGLGLVPGAGWWWTLAPQALVGLGLALTLPGLTERALGDRDPEGRRASGTIAARHAGVVAGIVALTAVFNTQLEREHDAVLRSGTALLLDAPLSPSTKVELADAIAERVDVAEGELPTVSAVFDTVEPEPGSEDDYAELEARMSEEVQRAATHAFNPAFLVAAAIALLALFPIATLPRRG